MSSTRSLNRDFPHRNPNPQASQGEGVSNGVVSYGKDGELIGYVQVGKGSGAHT